MLFDFVLGSEFLWVFIPPVAVQLTDDIMLLWELVANNIQPTGLTIDKQTIGNFFDKWWLCRTYPKWNCIHKLKIILL